ncbi:hypothetical protein CVM73_38530 [Bradyrhizobium forestalis]|uniref:Restriction endonuclease type IV Mrr domain-containing protein n=1 Tax=Bradyrhizobium forestalis TaxID=1419263 RepID=A0A2M8QWV1_9BRAD|nr:hypothetical protein CVM73_38530 [Bradyrhizobium forestalis]
MYDFRPWLRLEATGRAGSDDGFDVRGIEPGDATTEEPDDTNDDDDESSAIDNPISERTWLIQCKREKTIGPTKLRKYLDEIGAEERKALYGIIFVASADSSKTSRDVMATWVRENGLSEFQIWSVSDIETMLIQPKNDHILFAFFGISLQVRKRSVASALRSRITMKRKISRILSKRMYAPFLLRDPDASDFPYINKGEELRWMVRVTGWTSAALDSNSRNTAPTLIVMGIGMWQTCSIVRFRNMTILGLSSKSVGCRK